jgi:hypothetical protein
VVDAESSAIEHYRDIIHHAESNDDPVTVDLVTQLLADEEEHLTLFQGFQAAHWLEWMDSRYELAGRDVLRHPPSEYFDRQCWVAGEPGERMFPAIAELVGAHKLLWASDYPHEEGHRDPVALLVDTLAGLDAEDRQRILGGNAAEIYGLGP